MIKTKILIAGLTFLMPIMAFADTAATGQAIAAAYNKRDVEAMVRMIDAKAIARVVLKDLDVKDGEAINRGFVQGLRTNIDIGMRSLESAKGTVKFVRAGKRGAKNYALVRYDLGDQGVDYVEYFISDMGRVEDWYIHSMATLYSTSASFNLATILKKDSMLFGIFGPRLTGQADLKPFNELRANLQAQDFAAAYKTLETFPESFRKNRQWALMRVTIGGRIDDATHRTALRYLAQNFGNEPELQFMLIDHYILEKQYDRALGAVAAVERSIGGEDAATAHLRGGILIGARRFDEAALACRRSMTLETTYASGYWCLVEVGTTAKDGKIAVEGLKAYEKAFNTRFDLAKLGTLEQYKEVARTPEFIAWKKSRH